MASIGVVGSYGIDTLIWMVKIETLEMSSEPWYAHQTSIGDLPVWQQAFETWENIKVGICSSSTICGKKCGYHYVWRIFSNCSVFGIKRLTGKGGVGRINGIGIFCLYSLLINIKLAHKFVKYCTFISIAGITRRTECRRKAYGCHLIWTALCRGHQCIHILYTARLGDYAVCI